MSNQTSTSRHREMASPIYDDWRQNTAYRSWSGTSESSGSHQSYLLTKVTDDFVTPNFEKRRGDGEIIMNPFASVTTEVSDPVVTGVAKLVRSDGYLPLFLNGSFPSSHFCSTNSFPSMTFVNPDIIAEQAVTKAYANLASTPFQSLVSIAEAKKTYDTVVSVFTQARDLIVGGLKLRRRLLNGDTISSISKQAIRRNGGTFKSINKASKRAGNAYLQYRYGLRPLVYELKGLIKALQERPPRYTFTGYADYQSGRETDPSDDTWYEFLAMKRSSSIRQEISALAKILVEPKSQTAMSDIVDPLGIDNYFQAGWELIPFSFVVDWFLNVGDIVASFEPITDYNILGSCVTTRERIIKSNECKQFAAHSNNVTSMKNSSPYHLTFEEQWSVPNLKYEHTETRVTRTIAPRRSVIPSLDINLDVAKLVDILALIRQFYA